MLYDLYFCGIPHMLNYLLKMAKLVLKTAIMYRMLS